MNHHELNTKHEVNQDLVNQKDFENKKKIYLRLKDSLQEEQANYLYHELLYQHNENLLQHNRRLDH